jgi:carbonic anhydrase
MVEGVKRSDSFISDWMQMATPVCTHAREIANGRPFIRVCEQEAIRLSLGNLLTFPWIRDRVERGKLTLHGWYFDLEAGELLRYEPQTGVFESL